jgi:hypothetical protein
MGWGWINVRIFVEGDRLPHSHKTTLHKIAVALKAESFCSLLEG